MAHQDDWLAERFEQQRGRLRTLAYRMLGSTGEAEEAVQEAWIRLSRADSDSIENLSAWLTTVVSRVCLNVLQARRAHPEVPLEAQLAEQQADDHADSDPAREALLADSIGLALLVVLDRLSPAERVAFVLHDMFGVAFEEIAPIVGRNATSARQLASRARRRVQGGDVEADAGRLEQARLVEAFMAAARHGEFDRLLSLLDPDVTLHADQTAVAMGAPAHARGASEVAGFMRRARGAQPALLDGMAALVWMPGGELRVVHRLLASEGRITAIELIADPARLASLDLSVLEQ